MTPARCPPREGLSAHGGALGVEGQATTDSPRAAWQPSAPGLHSFIHGSRPHRPCPVARMPSGRGHRAVHKLRPYDTKGGAGGNGAGATSPPARPSAALLV